MIKTVGVDTNVLLAFRLQREPVVNEVRKLFEQALVNKAKIYIPIPVLLEVEWVLRSYYKQSKEAITPFYEELLLIDNVLTDNKEDIKFAINLYKTNNTISFTDAIIVTLTQSKNYEFLTYDRDLEKIYQSLL